MPADTAAGKGSSGRATPSSSRVLAVLPAVLCTMGVFVLGSIHGGPPGLEVSDKVAHAFGFAVLAASYWWAFAGRLAPMARAMRGALAACGVGALLEVWQSFLPYRSAELLDFVADAVGAVSASAVLALLRSFGTTPDVTLAAAPPDTPRAPPTR
jgi:VanZ family protein